MQSPGPDGIQAEHLRHGGFPLILFLTRIFKAILVTGRVPASFACGYVIPLLKSTDKDPSIPFNYRGISLTLVVGKVFERLLLSRLLNFIRLSPLQGGFRAGQSSLHTAFVFQETVTYLRECGHKAYVAFLDARKAFDTVWHEGLFVKLHRAGIPHSLWFLLVSWYRQCTSSVVWGNSCLRSFSLNQGFVRVLCCPRFFTLFLLTIFCLSSLLLAMVLLLMVFIVVL